MPDATRSRTRGIRMSHSEYLKLCDWLRRYEVDLVQARLNNIQLAERATRELGFPVSKETVPQAKRDVNITWSVPHARTTSGNDKPLRQFGMLRVLTSTLIKLHEDLGQPVPHRLHVVHKALYTGRPGMTEAERAELDALRSEPPATTLWR